MFTTRKTISDTVYTADGKLAVTRISPLSGKQNTMMLDISWEQMALYNDPQQRLLIQTIFPNLTPDEREFIKTGYTPEDWVQMFQPINKDSVER